jgi:hypothetical protein
MLSASTYATVVVGRSRRSRMAHDRVYRCKHGRLSILEPGIAPSGTIVNQSSAFSLAPKQRTAVRLQANP